jgi:hypothetical protein
MVRALAVLVALSTSLVTAPAVHAEPAASPDSAAASTQPVPAGNSPARAGNAPQWVQYPYLSGGSKGKLTVVAQVFLDPKRTRARNGFAQDKVSMRVAVAKKKFSKVNKPRSVEVLTDSALLTRSNKTRKVSVPGVMTIKLALSKKVSDKLRDRGFKGRRAAIAVSMSHRKDTKKGGSAHELTQVSVGTLVAGKWSKAKVQRATAAAVQQRRNLRRSAALGSELADATLASTPETPFFNNIYIQNSSPFQQQITFQPAIQCMYAANTRGQAPPAAAQSTINAADTVMFQYALAGGWLEPSKSTPGLYGWEKGLKAPGNQKTLTTDLVNAGNAAGQSALKSATRGRSYSQAGAVGAVAAASVKFVLSFLKGLDASKCTNTSDYPQLFGVSTAVTGFGTNGVTDPTQATLPATNTWAGTPAAGNQGAVTAAPDSGFITGSLLQSLGAQTDAIYYWNGGAPAPMVSPNASKGEYTGGSATFQGGLMQYVGPSPGFPTGAYECQDGPNLPPDDEYCNYTTSGQMYIQLSYLTNPEYSAGLLNEGSAPVMTANVDASGNYTLQCDLSQMTATLSTPFGSAAPTTVEQSTLATTPTNSSGQLPQNAQWLVSFFGVTAEGESTYISESLTQTTNGVNTPYLSPNAANQQVSIQAASAGGSQAVALGTIAPADLNDMVTLDGEPAVPTQFGCTASPTVSLPGLSITAADGSQIANAYGNQWPMPTQSGKGWPVGTYGSNKAPFNYKWQSGVKNLNVTFQGPPLSAITDVP